MEPKVTIESISRTKISDESQVDRAIVIFSFDQPVVQWTSNVLGVSPTTGFVADSGAKNVDTMKAYSVDQMKNFTVEDAMYIQDITPVTRTVDQMKLYSVDAVKLLTVDEAKTTLLTDSLSAEIDWTELYQEGSNRVNIYGKNIKNEWTPYEG